MADVVDCSDPLEKLQEDAVGIISSPDLRESSVERSPSPDLQYVRVRSATWNPDASQHIRPVSRSRSRSPATSDGSGRSRGSPRKAQEPSSPQPPLVLLSDANADGDALLRWRPRPGTPIPDDSMVERAVRAALHTAEEPARNTLATHLARGLSDAWQHDMHRRRSRCTLSAATTQVHVCVPARMCVSCDAKRSPAPGTDICWGMVAAGRQDWTMRKHHRRVCSGGSNTHMSRPNKCASEHFMPGPF